MANTAGNTAKQLPDAEVTAEPSMEEILASIKQIIADDELPQDGKTERERYSYPEGHSNSNDALEGEDALALDMEAALQAELEGTIDVQPTAAAAAELTISDKAAQVRAELSAVGAGLSADERIAQYRSQGKLQIEALAAANAERAAARAEEQARAAAKPAPTPIPAAPVSTGPLLPTTNAIAQEMAATMMSEKSGEIQTLLSDLMRPTIRQWLSDNLPTMVEKLVREEIQAASRGRNPQA